MIDIFISEKAPDVGYVWNVEDVFKLRQDHRIVGSLSGCLPSTPRNHHFLGVPLILSQEEVDLAVKEGFGNPVTAPMLSHLPTPEIKTAFDDFRQSSFNDQIEINREHRKREIVRMSDKIIEGKRRKHLSENPDSKLDESDLELTRDTVLEKEFAKIKDVSKQQEIIQTFNAHPWIRAEDKKPFHWQPPSNPRERIRRLTFRALWLRGFYITFGDKFGGDFLLYEGDPVLFHARFVVICSTESELAGFRDRDLVCRSRLGTAVKKTILIAYAQETASQNGSQTQENGATTSGDDEESYKAIVFKALKRLSTKKAIRPTMD